MEQDPGSIGHQQAEMGSAASQTPATSTKEGVDVQANLGVQQNMIHLLVSTVHALPASGEHVVDKIHHVGN